VKGGIIKECEITGSVELELMKEKLIGCRHTVPDFIENFKDEDILITGEDVYNFF